MGFTVARVTGIAVLMLVGAPPALARADKSPEATAPDTSQKPAGANPDDKFVYRPPETITAGEKIGTSAENMATKPLKDLNLKKEEIPPLLQDIVKAPYALKGMRKCSDYKRGIDELTRILGPDVDSGIKKKGQNAGEFALGAAESVVGSLIPGAGLIRKISGAEAAQKRARAAVLAGNLRRAYLKGTARAKGCRV